MNKERVYDNECVRTISSLLNFIELGYNPASEDFGVSVKNLEDYTKELLPNISPLSSMPKSVAIDVMGKVMKKFNIDISHCTSLESFKNFNLNSNMISIDDILKRPNETLTLKMEEYTFTNEQIATLLYKFMKSQGYILVNKRGDVYSLFNHYREEAKVKSILADNRINYIRFLLSKGETFYLLDLGTIFKVALCSKNKELGLHLDTAMRGSVYKKLHKESSICHYEFTPIRFKPYIKGVPVYDIYGDFINIKKYKTTMKKSKEFKSNKGLLGYSLYYLLLKNLLTDDVINISTVETFEKYGDLFLEIENSILETKTQSAFNLTSFTLTEPKNIVNVKRITYNEDVAYIFEGTKGNAIFTNTGLYLQFKDSRRTILISQNMYYHNINLLIDDLGNVPSKHVLKKLIDNYFTHKISTVLEYCKLLTVLRRNIIEE